MTTTAPARSGTDHTIRAQARLTTTAIRHSDGTIGTRIRTLRSEPPLLLRPTDPGTSEVFPGCRAAQVHMVAGAAGPLGGDHIALDVDVAADTALILREVGSTLLLPGQHPGASLTRIRIHVATRGTFVWNAEPIIAAHGCDHHNDIHITLDNQARLLLRDSIVLGRHGEHPGDLRHRLRICCADQPLYTQELTLGAHAPGWAGPAITGGHRALGSIIVVDPALRHDTPVPTATPDTAVSPLPGPGLVITAAAPDALALHHQLEAALTAAVIEKKGIGKLV